MPRGQEGFTLLELLIVVLIVSILAAIALPALLSQSDKANLDAVVSDLRNASLLLEAGYSETIAYPPPGPVPGFPSSRGVTITVVASSTIGYCLEAWHPTVDTDGVPGPDRYRFDTRIVARMSGVELGACPP